MMHDSIRTGQANEQNNQLNFTNTQVRLKDASTQDIEYLPVSPKFRNLNLAINLFILAILLTAICIFELEFIFAIPDSWRSFLPISYVILITLCVLSTIYHYFADKKLGYALREYDIHYKSGLIFKSYVSQPILRIQHVEIKRGPLERQNGLASLQLFSAGGASYTFSIPGLTIETASSLRQFLLDHSDIINKK